MSVDSPAPPPTPGGPWNNPVLAAAVVRGGAPAFDLTCSTCKEAPLVRSDAGAIICSAWCDMPGEDTIETWSGPSEERPL